MNEMYRCNAPSTANWFRIVSSPPYSYARFNVCMSYAVNSAKINTPNRLTIAEKPAPNGTKIATMPTTIKPIMPMVKNVPMNDRSLIVLYPNIAMQPNINAATPNAHRIDSGLTDRATAINGVMVTPINTEYSANSNAAVAGFK